MHLLGIIRSHCTLFLVLFVAHFTTRSHGQAALDFMDMETSTPSPSQENSAPCKGDGNCAILTQEIDTKAQFTGFCTSPPRVPFATLKDDFLEQTVFPKDTVVSYECKTGYEHVPGTNKFVTCVDDGKWSPPDTFCKPNFCGPPPHLKYGIPKEEYLEKTIFPKGTEIKYVCRLGYVRIPSSSSVVTCMADSTWSSPRTFCQPKSCGNPGEVADGMMLAESFDFGSRVKYVCNVGYKMISKRDYRDCQVDGKWSNDLPECIAMSCPSPLDIVNGHYYPQKEEYAYLDSVKYICNGNLALIGEQNVFCTAEGKWSSNAPECKAVQCRNPNVENAFKLSGIRGPYNLNWTVRFGCRPQYKLIGSDTVTCNQNSEWEPELPKCLGICRSIPHIPFAELAEPTTDTTFLEGTTLKFRCIQGYEPVSGAVNTAKCSRLQWSYFDGFCKPITCVQPEPVPYGKMISGSFSFGDRIMYACETGYMIKHKYRKCLSDRSWSLPIPECEVQTCTAPAYVNNGRFGPEKEKYLYNDTITYDCYEGFQLVGQASITCRHDGRWNYQTPECRGICNAPPHLDNAQLQHHFTTIQTYFTGTRVQYTCKPGYYRDRHFTDTVTCLGNFTWSNLSYEFCQIYKCPTPAFMKNGWYDPAMQEYLYNDTITYDCHEGFQLVGQDLLTCREGRWNYNPPECRGICQNPPDLPYAQLDFRFKHQTIFFAGSTVQYNCRPGYIPSYNNFYSNSISCLGNFTWSKIYNNFCNRTSCGHPPKVANASFEAKDFLFESEALYECEKGFKMVSQNKSVKCGANGRWNGALPICEVQKCSPPEDLKDGSYSIKKNEYTYNEAVIYKCDTLQLVGKASVTCSDEGKWSSGAPQCKAVCIFPPKLDFAVVEEEFIHQEFFDSGKTVQYKCDPGFVPVTGKSNKLTCLNTLKWSQYELFCTRISCANPGAIDYGQMQSENFLFGSRVNYTCNPGYSMITRRNYRECQADGTWSGKPPVCKEPVCESIWELQEEARKCTSTPDEWIKYLQVQYLYLQIENLKLDIEIKKRQMDSPL